MRQNSWKIEGVIMYTKDIYLEKGDKVRITTPSGWATGTVISASWYEDAGWYIELNVEEASLGWELGYSYYKQRDDGGTVEKLEHADMEDVVEAIQKLPFMPEKGPPLPEYVAAELYPSPTWDLMKAPVSDYGKAVVDETAQLLREFMRGGNFELRSKFEETGWSSDGIIYTGNLTHTPTRAQYLTEVYVSFAWRDPTKDVTRTITLFEEKPEGPEDIWEGDLSYEGGRAADSALRR